MRRALLAAGVAAALLGAAACGEEPADDPSAEQSGAEQGEGPQGQEQPEMPEPDLEGIPDVVAEVNGTEISRDEFVELYEGQFQQMAMEAQMQGQEVDEDAIKDQTLEGLIGIELLNQEVEDRDITVSDEDVEESLDEAAEANGMADGDEFLSAMEEQGTDPEEARSEMEQQARIDALIADESGDLSASDEELHELYDEMIEQQEQQAEQQEDSDDGEQPSGEAETPPFDEMRPQLEEQVENEKEAEVVQGMVDSLRESGEVSSHL